MVTVIPLNFFVQIADETPLFELGETGDVFADDVEFEVDAVADLDVAEVGVLEGVRDDGDAERARFAVADC